MLICTGVALALVFGCTSQKGDVKPAPAMDAVTLVNGKGIPNGRSDTNEGYIPLSQTATDPSYGFATDNPVKVGGAKLREGPSREKAYLNALRGPAAQPIEYERMGSCCPFETPNELLGGGLLDAFRITYEAQSAPATIFINFYDEGPLLVPMGFTARQSGQ